mgnify:CR=1 FL=1
MATVKQLLDAELPPRNNKAENARKATEARAAARAAAKAKIEEAEQVEELALWEAFSLRYCATLELVPSYEATYGKRRDAKEATRQASALMRRPEVQRMIARNMRPVLEVLGVTKDWSIQRLLDEIDGNLLDYVHPDGTLMSLSEIRSLPRHKQRLIVDMKLVESRESIEARKRWEVACEVAKASGVDPPAQPPVDHLVRPLLVDKQKAMQTLARIQGWIGSDGTPQVSPAEFIRLLTEAREKAMVRREEVMKVAPLE